MAHRIRRHRSRVPGGFVASAAAAAVVLAVLARHPSIAAAAPGKAAAAAIGYARSQSGCPYVWGGTGPCGSGFDCSGLVMEAYAAAGVTIQRTSQEQWASEPHVASPQPGDLVFFAGAGGTTASPGHVGLVVDPARHLMIDAYGARTAVREETWGLPGSAPGLAWPVGFTDPAAAS
jgi:cell wall-associated NlpC family hydrolase